MKIEAIEKREDVSPKEGKSKYGDVTFADEKNKKYPLDSETHVRAAWSYINMDKNAKKYSREDVATIKRKIKAAGKKYGIEFADDDDDHKDKEDKAESSLIYAAAAVDLEGQTPCEIVYMPRAEEITITPIVGGKAKAVALKVDASVAEILQADLAQRLNDPVRPYAGFDHRPGPASFLPKEFWWDDERGVILEVDWTQAGKEAVQGRNYSYFSPTFLLSGKRVKGLPASGEVGSMTNNPAFRVPTMKIAASAAEQGDPMANAIAEKLFELDVISAEQAQDADQDFVLRAVTGLHEALTLAQATNARLERENTALQAKVAEVRKAEATTIIEAAIAEGKIPGKDQSAIDFWTAQLVACPETTKKVLATLPANPLLQRVIDVKVKDGKKLAQGQSEADLVQAQHLAIAKVRKANPNLSYMDAFNEAKREQPEVFPAEA